MEISEFVAKTLTFRDQLHILHWKTDNYAEHVALGELYTFILGWLDGFVESWQGYDTLIGVKDFTVNVAHDGTSCVEAYVTELREFSMHLRATDLDSDFLVNDIQTALTQCNKTLYKLYNLS